MIRSGRGVLPAVAGEGEQIERQVVGMTFPPDQQHRSPAAGTQGRSGQRALLLLLWLAHRNSVTAIGSNEGGQVFPKNAPQCRLTRGARSEARGWRGKALPLGAPRCEPAIGKGLLVE